MSQTIQIPPPPNELPIINLFKNHNQTTSSNNQTWSELCEMVITPISMAKNHAPCIAVQLSGVKTKEAVLAHNQMTMLSADIDEGDLPLNEVKAKLAILGLTRYTIYSTASSMRLDNDGKLNGKRWRILVPLLQPINCAIWSILQEALANQFNGDYCTTRVQQILYAPNNPGITDKRETKHYEYYIENGALFNFSVPMVQVMYDEYIKIKIKIQKQNTAINTFKPKSPKQLLGGQISVIDTYNERHSIESELTNRGDKRPRREGGKWTCYASKSGAPGISIKDGKMYSHSESDPLCDGKAHDSFDVFMNTNGWKFKQALEHISKTELVNPDDKNSKNLSEHNKAIWKQKCRDSFTGDLKNMADTIESTINKMLTGTVSVEKTSDLMNWSNIQNCWDKSFVHGDKTLAINCNGDLPIFTTFNFNKKIMKQMFGNFIDKEALENECFKKYGDKDKKADNKVKQIINKINDIVIGHLETYRQRSVIEYSTDMFADEPRLLIGKEKVKHISIHTSFPVDYIDPAIIEDYKQHFTYLDDLLNLLVAARFATDRKKAFFWLYACSDWGKKLFTDVFKEFGILVEMSVKEIEKSLEGDPIGRTAKDFKDCWILFIDEFKKINSEVKQLTSNISGSPKHEMHFTAELYTKLFASAEEVESLAGSAGVEEQFSNRFSLIPTLNSTIDSRPLFKKSSALYFDSIKSYIAQYLNFQVEQYIKLGRIEASNRGTLVLAENNKINRLGSHFGELDDSIKEMTDKIRNCILDPNCFTDGNVNQVIYHKRSAKLVQNIDKIIDRYIKDNIPPSEQVKVRYKKKDIRQLLDESDRENKNGPVRVIFQGEIKSTSKKGIIIIMPPPPPPTSLVPLGVTQG